MELEWVKTFREYKSIHFFSSSIWSFFFFCLLEGVFVEVCLVVVFEGFLYLVAILVFGFCFLCFMEFNVLIICDH